MKEYFPKHSTPVRRTVSSRRWVERSSPSPYDCPSSLPRELLSCGPGRETEAEPGRLPEAKRWGRGSGETTAAGVLRTQTGEEGAALRQLQRSGVGRGAEGESSANQRSAHVCEEITCSGNSQKSRQSPELTSTWESCLFPPDWKASTRETQQSRQRGFCSVVEIISPKLSTVLVQPTNLQNKTPKNHTVSK